MIHQLTPSCIAVIVPEDASGFLVSNAQLDNDLVYLKDGSYKYIASLPGEIGNWKILGRGNDLTEEQWKGIVAQFVYKSPFGGDGGETKYNDYTCDRVDALFKTATESGLSLLKAHNLEPDVLILVNNKQ